ncbi:MAG: four helix bundle protein [Cyclobacteriaceae bacterium]|nr:four helix bundle protein [Cyclobacteriaceae bacterium]
MPEITSYKDLDVWKTNRELVKSVYQLSKSFPKEELYGLTNQVRRAAVSIPSNIAEGCGRNHFKDSIQFFFIARASLYEVETQLILSNDLAYTSEEQLTAILGQVTRCKKLLNGFINYYQKQTNNNQPTSINEILEEYGSNYND